MYQRSVQLKIGIPWEWYQRLVNVDDSYDLVLRIFETRQPHIDYLPHEIKVTVNGSSIPPQKTIIATEAGILPKPIAKPMTLTRFIKKRSKTQADNQHFSDIINISWAHCDGKRGRATPPMNYVIGVGRSNSLNEVVKRMSERKRPRSIEETEKLLKSKISGGNGDVQLNAMKIKFIDAIKMSIIKTPVRFDKCQHLDCFDLESYLMMNQVKPSWACPICNGRFAFGTLRHDLWFGKIMRDAGNGCREIIMNGDGSFKITEKEDENEDNNLDDEKHEKKEDKISKKHEKIAQTPDEKHMNRILADENNTEINAPIFLESSDDEDFGKSSKISSKISSRTNPKTATKTATKTVVQIDLDDSDDLGDYDSENEVPKTSVVKPKPLREGFGRRFKRKKVVSAAVVNQEISRISKHFENQKYTNFNKSTPMVTPEKASFDEKSTEPGKKWELKVPSAPGVLEGGSGWGTGNPFSDDRR